MSGRKDIETGEAGNASRWRFVKAAGFFVQAGVESYLMLVLLPVGLCAAEHARVIADSSEGTDKSGRAKKGGRLRMRKGVIAVFAFSVG